MIRYLLIFALGILAGLADAQVVVDHTLAKRYDQEISKQTPSYQQLVKAMNRHPELFGLAIFTLHQTDTLNKKDFTNYNNDGIFSIDTDKVSGKIIYHKDVINYNENTFMPVPCTATLHGDTLIITTEGPFFPYLVHKIVKHKVISTYEEHYRHDTILRKTLLSPRSNILSVPTQTALFNLSTLHFKAEETIYGEVDFMTNFYYIDDPDSATGYLSKKFSGKYIFKTIIKDDKGLPEVSVYRN